MSKPILAACCAAIALALGGCVSMAPKLPAAQAGIPASWPLPEATAAEPGRAEDIGWRQFFTDPKLARLIELSLDNNRDLRVAVLNVEKARAQYRIQRADRVPSVNVTGQSTRTGVSGQPLSEQYRADLGTTNFELDLFGRVNSLSNAALERYLAQDESRRSTQLSLIAEVANAYLTLAADQESLKVAQATRDNQEVSFELTSKRHALGAASQLDLSQAQTTVESARADMARYTGLVAQDTNALRLLVGAQLDDALLPDGLDGDVTMLGALPAGLPSDVLLRRPDILQTEHLLRAANADIGAARAAFFPSIQLTGSVGTVSNDLSGLFKSGSGTWTFMPQITVPIFQGGRLTAQLAGAKADQQIALAQYEKAIQTGFREVADALVLTRTLADQRQAQEALESAAARADELSKARYRAGRDSYLESLVTQRSLYSAQQQLIATRLAEQTNRVTLYKVLGGGWNERAP
ncbi:MULTISPECIES: efflux transporter outer membrane subunit [unclassified Dyella]|uniref:efflux transporter outer membrane subunit n=1 Tax=unclassified Dyella TaxID=2634549 RepID=UPI000C84CE6A|nr:MULTISPECIES: efflux transporter outer membrane subunit [unclassified Dyella]MDR3447852.1 efflux transporter outer membrane subunit [Dyella sp.]PMQ03463.1 Outer membrane protein OprM [Dyella sp. AD56]